MKLDNSPKKDKDRSDAMKKRRADAISFLKKSRYNIKKVSSEELKNMWEWELIFLTIIWRMWSSSYHFAVLENDNVDYYLTDWYDKLWFKAIIDIYKWLEDYSDDNLMSAFRKEYNFKNFNFIDTWFWTWLFVNKKIFDEIKDFIQELSTIYESDIQWFFWYDWIEVSKIYFSWNKDKFLSSIQ